MGDPPLCLFFLSPSSLSLCVTPQINSLLILISQEITYFILLLHFCLAPSSFFAYAEHVRFLPHALSSPSAYFSL